MIRFQFNSIKTTQAACYLLKRNGGRMSKGFLLKMLYLADRELLRKRGQPITGDQPVSMKNGPVLSKTYDLTKGGAMEHRAYWEKHVTDAPTGQTYISLKQPAEMNLLSKREIETLEAVFQKFHNFSWKQLVDFCHDLPEWKNPGDSSYRIEFENILTALGKKQKDILQVQNHALESQWIDLVMPNQVPA